MQVGRTLAPVLATQVYKYFTAILGVESGLNVAYLFMTFWAVLGNGAYESTHRTQINMSVVR